MEIKPPKRMADWVGAKVKTRYAMENGYAKMPAGSVAIVVRVSKGFSLEFEPCSCCGMTVKCSQVRPEHLEIIELPPKGAIQ